MHSISSSSAPATKRQKTEVNTPLKLLKLEPNLLSKIFSYLPASAHAQTSQTCKGIHSSWICNEYPLDGALLSDQDENSLIRIGRHYPNLSLRCSEAALPVLSPARLLSYSRAFPTAKTLGARISLDEPFTAQRIIESFPRLQSITIKDVKNSQMQQLPALRRLTEVNIGFGFDKIEEDQLRHLGSLSHNIKTLDFLGCRWMDGDLLQYLSPLTNLEHLDLSECGEHGIISEVNGLRHLATLTHLKSLVFYEAAVDDEAIAHLAPLTQLTKLELISCECTNAGVQTIANNHPNLREFIISSNSRAATGGALQFIAQLTELRKLDCAFLNYQGNEADSDLLVTNYLARLTELENLAFGFPMSDRTLLVLLACLPKLHIVDINARHDDPNLTNLGIQAFNRIIEERQSRFAER